MVRVLTTLFFRLYSSSNMVKSSRQIINVLRNADAVCFDVDSTVIQEEGLDDLANFCGKGQEVAAMTRGAMGGGVCYRESLTRRLNLIKPSVEILKRFLRTHRFTLTPGIRDLVQRLQDRGTDVYLVSGGFQCVLQPVARELGIPREHVFANKLIHNREGKYIGFDPTIPTSVSGGKGIVLGLLRARYGYKNLVMVGDGATDLEACPPAHAFIGFGGNVMREEVKANSAWYVTSFYELIKEVDEQL